MAEWPRTRRRAQRGARGDSTGGASDEDGHCPCELAVLLVEREEDAVRCDGEVHDDACAAQAAGVDLAVMGGCKTVLSDWAPCGPRFCDVRTSYCEIYLSDVFEIPTCFPIGNAGIVPAFTVITVKAALLDEHPWLAEALYDGFAAARANGVEPNPTVAKVVDGDQVPIGLSANRASFEDLLTLGRERENFLIGRIDRLEGLARLCRYPLTTD